MANLLDLTSQGDVGTIADDAHLSTITLMDPQQLYELWERQNWVSATSTSAATGGLGGHGRARRRASCAWNLSVFFIGEERVTTQFGGFVGAYEDQREEAFL